MQEFVSKCVGFIMFVIGVLVTFTVIAVVLLVIECGVSGYVVSVLWGWFVVPKFGLPELDILYAIGISLTLSTCLNSSSVYKTENEKLDYVKLANKLAISPAIALGAGWLIKNYAM